MFSSLVDAIYSQFHHWYFDIIRDKRLYYLYAQLVVVGPQSLQLVSGNFVSIGNSVLKREDRQAMEIDTRLQSITFYFCLPQLQHINIALCLLVVH